MSVQVADPDMDCGITTAAFHPDGLIMATGCQDATVRIWDVKSQKVINSPLLLSLFKSVLGLHCGP